MQVDTELRSVLPPAAIPERRSPSGPTLGRGTAPLSTPPAAAPPGAPAGPVSAPGAPPASGPRNDECSHA
eukprot:11844777-Alexandrium_andersonii.AAC.1